MSDMVKAHDCNVIHPDILNKVKDNMPNESTMRNLTEFFKIMGDGTRIQILCALVQSEMCVCDLAVLTNVTKSAISHQLRSLKESHLVKSRRSGKNVFYSLDDEHVKDILEKALEHIIEE
ncbi:MAG: metalloregulator ArsR/SmtB family transcription factor [Clostridiaceae bacterium]